MLKVLTGEVILWLTRRVCQVAWKFGKTPRDWQTGVIIPIFKKGDCKQCTSYRGISLLSLPGKVCAKCREIMESNLEDAVRFLSGSQHYGPNLHSKANLREILKVWQRSLRMFCQS